MPNATCAVWLMVTVISMIWTGRSPIRWTVAGAFFLVCLLLAGAVGFFQGKASAERTTQIQVANDDAFYSLYALKALKEPQSEKWQTFFQVSLDGSALKLSEMCVSHPELIGNTNYNLLIQIEKYLNQHGQAPDRIASLRPVEQVAAKIREATVKLELVHPDVSRWEEEESRRTEFPASSK